ncbi:TlpA family protein disulfide reductase [Candidatus Nomurabacteria bacterium]|nr:TlpA family protein disulfide reductase [Candidatus Nomurabacteria bacterium]
MKTKQTVLIITALIIAGAGYYLYIQRDSLNPESESRSGAFLTADSTDETSDENSNNSENITVELSSFNDLGLKTLDGDSYDFTRINTDLIVLNSWATWCPFCIDELPDFIKVQSEFNETVTFIAINRSESNTSIKSYLSTNNIETGIIYLLDLKDSFYKKIGGFSMPETVIYDSEGNELKHIRGPVTYEEMKSELKNLLKVN